MNAQTLEQHELAIAAEESDSFYGHLQEVADIDKDSIGILREAAYAAILRYRERVANLHRLNELTQTKDESNQLRAVGAWPGLS